MPNSRRTSVAEGSRTPGKGSSPSMRRGITLPPSESSSSSTGHATQRTMTTGYGSTSTSSTLAGLGFATGQRVDGALASPRRISTSQAPPSAFKRSQSPAPLVPTHEAYYSQTQPPTATTPRFRDRDVIAQSQGNSPRHDAFYLQSSLTKHRRNFSNTSGILKTTTGPSSPVGSVFRKLRHKASNIGLSLGKPDAYDEDMGKDSDAEDEEPAQTANGTRVWYSSYVTIDWLHDAVCPISWVELMVDQRVY
jgi:chloride channel 3/4/5